MSEHADRIPEFTESPCNICGRGWPYHEDSCAYKQTALRVAELERELEEARQDNANLSRSAAFTDGVFEKALERAEAAEAKLAETRREADLQLGDKLEAQMALLAITEALDLRLSDMGDGWKDGVLHILARIEKIVDIAAADVKRAEAAERQLEETREALRAVWKVAQVADGGDPWYCEEAGIDVRAAYALARAALASAQTEESE